LRGAAKHGHGGRILAISLRTGGVANGPEMEDPLDPVEDCSEEEAPQTPPCAGRTAAASPPAGCGAADVQDDVGKVELPGEGDGLPEADTFGFDLQAFDAADEELMKLGEWKAPSEPSEASEDEAEGVALPEEEWERWSRKEREMWERIRPRHVRREAQQVHGLKMPDTVLTRILRLHPQFQAKSKEALELINFSSVLLLQAVAKAAVRGKTPGQRISFEDFKGACNLMKELHFLQPFSCTFDASTFSTKAEATNRKDGGQREGAEVEDESTPEKEAVKTAHNDGAKKRKADKTDARQKPSKARKAEPKADMKVPKVAGLDSFFRRIDG